MGAVAAGEITVLGPIVALIVHNFGFRFCSSLGAIICTSAMAGCLLFQDFATFKILYGFVMGVGAAFMYIPANTVSSFYFRKRQALALGIVAAGASIGFTVFPLAFSFIYQYFYLEGIFIFNIVACLALVPLILAFYPSSHEVEERTKDFVQVKNTRRISTVSVIPMTNKSSQLTNDLPSVNFEIKEQLTALCKAKVIAYMAAVLFQGAGHITLPLLIPKISHEVLDVPYHMSSLLLTLLGAAGIPSTILVGWIADKTWGNPLSLSLLGTAGSAMCCFLYPFAHAYWLMALTVGVQAVSWALYCGTFVLCPLTLVGLNNFNFVSGVAYGLFGVGSIMAPPVIGHLYENLLEHNILGIMFITGAFYSAAAIFSSISLLLHRSLQDSKQNFLKSMPRDINKLF